MLKIVWISHSSDLGGAERILLEGVEGLIARGEIVHVILPKAGNLKAYLDKLGATVSCTPLSWWIDKDTPSVKWLVKKFIIILLEAKKLSNILRKEKADVVITNTIAVPTGAFAAKLLRIPHVWYIHEFGKEDHKLSFEFGNKLSQFFMNTLSKKVIVNSKAVHNKFETWFSPGKIKLIYYAVKISELSIQTCNKFQKKDALELLLLGAQHAGKRQEDAIKAIAILCDKKINVRLTIAGYESSEYTPFLKNLSKKLGVGDKVKFLSFIDDPSFLLASTDALLMCSECEAFGRVTIEAMKFGKPVIGANSGGTSELINDGFNGFIYPNKNPDELVKKIERLYYDRDLLIKMGENGKSWANSIFNMENFISNLQEIIFSARKY